MAEQADTINLFIIAKHTNLYPLPPPPPPFLDRNCPFPLYHISKLYLTIIVTTRATTCSKPENRIQY
jgi:hypothetical protein